MTIPPCFTNSMVGVRASSLRPNVKQRIAVCLPTNEVCCVDDFFEQE